MSYGHSRGFRYARLKREVLGPLPDPETCYVCGNKAIYQFNRKGACRDHRDILSADLLAIEGRRSAHYQEPSAEGWLDKKWHAGHTKRSQTP